VIGLRLRREKSTEQLRNLKKTETVKEILENSSHFGKCGGKNEKTNITTQH
jgi:hypothetical protein